jgi:hypothetical protein
MFILHATLALAAALTVSATVVPKNETPSSATKLARSTSVTAAPQQTTGSFSGGVTTLSMQDGLGACGNIHSNSDAVASLASARYSSSLCGRQIKVTNIDNGKSVVATIASECVPRPNANSIDLSTGAFDQIASEAQGLVPVTVTFP